MGWLSQKRVVRVLDVELTAYGLYYDLDGEAWLISRGNEILLEVPRTWTFVDILVEDEVIDLYFKLWEKRMRNEVKRCLR